MRMWGLSANIMSLGGLAIAIGLLVDCAVVVVENIEHRMVDLKKADLPTRAQIAHEARARWQCHWCLGTAIIITVFPAARARGLEGRLFAPVALTIAFALTAALILALVVIPVLSVFVLRSWRVGRTLAGSQTFGFLRAAVPPSAASSARGCGGRRRRRFAKRLPPIRGSARPSRRQWTKARPSSPSAGSLTVSVETTAEMDLRIQREIMSQVPEIVGVMAWSGADEPGIDPVGPNETDMFLTLAPKEKWRNKSMDWVIDRLRDVLERIPACPIR